MFAISWPAATGQAMKLHRRVAHAGSSEPIDPAGSQARHGWPQAQFNADRTSGNLKYDKTKPTKQNDD
jgi:hypothetical protein